MKHWKTEINFEAWDEADAERMIQRMIRPVGEERRLLFATNAEETTEYRVDDSPSREKPDEFMGEQDPATRSDVSIYGAGSS